MGGIKLNPIVDRKEFNALDVANYFLSLVDDNAGELISNLKMQKLVYYAQAYYLAINDAPLFNEEIEAWMHGPVIPDLYHLYKSYGDLAIPKPENIEFTRYSEDVKDFLNDIYRVFGQFSAWKLRNMTHSEAPFIETYDKGGGIISNELMTNYYKDYVKK